MDRQKLKRSELGAARTSGKTSHFEGVTPPWKRAASRHSFPITPLRKGCSGRPDVNSFDRPRACRTMTAVRTVAQSGPLLGAQI
jgi:hypothetical protein